MRGAVTPSSVSRCSQRLRTTQRPCVNKIEDRCTFDFYFKHNSYLRSLFVAFAASLTIMRTSSLSNGHPKIYKSPCHRSVAVPMARAPLSNMYRSAGSMRLESVPYHFLSALVRSRSSQILDTADRRPSETRSRTLEIKRHRPQCEGRRLRLADASILEVTTDSIVEAVCSCGLRSMDTSLRWTCLKNHSCI